MILEEKSLTDKCRIIHEILESLPECTYETPNSELPTNGIYFFYEDREFCTHGNERQKRIVRVGTHRVDGNFRSRINSHYRGNKNSSVFRKLLGGALIRRKDPNDRRLKQWLEQDAPTFQEMEIEVTKTLKEHFSFRCIPVEDKEERSCLEEQLIATIAKCDKCRPSENWLGNFAADELIRKSGLWNHQHVTSKNYASEKTIKRLEDFANISSSDINRFKINDSVGTPDKRKIVLVTTCTGSKNKDIKNSVNFSDFKSLCLNCNGRSLSSCLVIRGWMEKLQKASEKVQAIDLYEGPSFCHVSDAFLSIDDDKFEKDLWIISAGYGLLSYNREVTKYNATFSHDDDKNYIKCPSWWDILTEYNDDYLYRRINSLSNDDTIFITLGNEYAKRIMNDIKKINPLCKVYFIVSGSVHSTLYELEKHQNIEFIRVQQPQDYVEYYDPKTNTVFKSGSYQRGLCQNVLSQVAIDLSRWENINIERALGAADKVVELMQKHKSSTVQSIIKITGEEKMSDIKVADETWIGCALLHYENPKKDSFSTQEIVNRIKKENIFGRLRTGIQWHVNLHCVANKKPNPGKYRILYDIDGRRRLFRDGDDFHPDRDGSKTKPELYSIPPKYHYLLDWYDNEYNTSGEISSKTVNAESERVLKKEEAKPEAADITQGLKCPKCGYINYQDSRFCEECGLQLNFCPNCRNPVKSTSKFCSKCGTKL